ncbi:MAG: glycosyltransferase, partial [Bacteroidota bacterium]
MAQPDKHIVFISPGFPLDEQDYLCIPPLQLFARELSQQPGIRLSVISLQYPYKAATTTWHGIPVRHCGGNNAGFPMRLRTWRRCLRHFRDLHRQHPVDVVHTFWYNEAAYLGQRLERQHGCRHICTLMGQDALPQNAYLGRLRLRDMTTVAISARQSEAFANATGSVPDHLIHWGLPAATDALPAGR